MRTGKILTAGVWLMVVLSLVGCSMGGQKQPEPSSQDIQQAVAKELRTPDMQQMIKSNIQQDQVAQMVKDWMGSDQGKQAVQKALAEVMKLDETKSMMSKAIQTQLKDPTTQRDIQDAVKEALVGILGRGLSQAPSGQQSGQQSGGQSGGGGQKSGSQSSGGGGGGS